MTTQQPLFTDEQDQKVAMAAAEEPLPVWLQRLSLLVLVLFCLYIGVLLAILPWSPRFWDHNAWLVAHPAVFAVAKAGWVRGVVSGVGLLDIWIGISEAVHYRDYRGGR